MAWVERSGENSWRVRYRRDSGGIGSVTGFGSEANAAQHAAAVEADQRRGLWVDPAGGKILIDEFFPDWMDSQDLDPRTEANRRSIMRTHISPRWGSTPLDGISNLKARAWGKKLRVEDGLSGQTVDGIIKVLSMMLTDAADEDLIVANPLARRRRGRRERIGRRREKTWTESSPALVLADNVATTYHPSGGVLVTTAGWTGGRWGELTGLQRPNLHLFDDDTGYFDIDPEIGCLHEGDDGRLWLGPPKTAASARPVTLPPFLVRLLRAHLDTHDHPHVFPSPTGELHRRSNFSRRAFRPAADGTRHHTRLLDRLEPAAPGLTFHGLRHSHKTWLITDGIPEIAQALRLGHVLKDKVQETYSHVATTVEDRLIQTLQQRWEKAAADASSAMDWRSAA